jgi:hypothetical protein
VANPIVREKPLQVEKTIVSIGSTGILLRPLQLIVWATLQPRGHYDLQPDAVWLPCVVDTGFNGTFCIAQEHLELVPNHERFLYMGFQQLTHRGGIETARRIEADLWIRAEVEGRGAVKVELPTGFYAFARRSPGTMTSAPLIGQAALVGAQARLEVDYRMRHFSLHETEQPKPARFVDLLDPGL